MQFVVLVIISEATSFLGFASEQGHKKTV